VDDVPGGTGHGLYVGTPGGTSTLALTLSNNTFSGVTGDVIQMPAPFARFTLDADANNFFDVGLQSPNYPAGPNDLAVDPLFRDPAAADYHLQPGSLLIDAGVSADLTLPAADFEGR